MASAVKNWTQLTSERRIASFVVLDLETNDLPYIPSKIAITELCMYGFAASELEAEQIKEISYTGEPPVPKRPRILHKFTMLFNPQRLIHPTAEEITGLSNYNLENESNFDENACNAIINFIKHMQQPACLIAHNGDYFDFPIVKQTFDKYNLELPNGTLCLDSLRAFWGIDEQMKLAARNTVLSAPTACQTNPQQQRQQELLPVLDTEKTTLLLDTKSTLADPPLHSASTRIIDSKETLAEQLAADAKINWRARNETTPTRPTVAGAKRPHSKDSTPSKISSNDNITLKSKRALFASKKGERFPPKGIYKLGNMYERHFNAKPKQVHYAEADVETLMHVMKVYGIDFLAYAENHAIPFNEVKMRR